MKYLLLAMVATIQLACTQNRIPKPNWRLKTDDTYMTIAVNNNRPAIYALKNTKNGWNWMSRFSEMPFPEKVQIGSIVFRPNWKYKDAIIDTSEGTKLNNDQF